MKFKTLAISLLFLVGCTGIPHPVIGQSDFGHVTVISSIFIKGNNEAWAVAEKECAKYNRHATFIRTSPLFSKNMAWHYSCAKK